MNKILIIIVLLSLSVSTFAASKVTSDRNWFILGLKVEKLIGQGVGENNFRFGPGLTLEFGGFKAGDPFGVAFGTGFYQTTNHVGEDKINGTFYTPFFVDYRPFQRNIGKFIHSASIGFSWNLMFLEHLENPESHLLISFGIVEQLPLSDTRLLQFMIKPYVNVFNDLQQDFGIEFNFAWGSLFDVNDHSGK